MTMLEDYRPCRACGTPCDGDPNALNDTLPLTSTPTPATLSGEDDR